MRNEFADILVPRSEGIMKLRDLIVAARNLKCSPWIQIRKDIDDRMAIPRKRPSVCSASCFLQSDFLSLDTPLQSVTFSRSWSELRLWLCRRKMWDEREKRTKEGTRGHTVYLAWIDGYTPGIAEWRSGSDSRTRPGEGTPSPATWKKQGNASFHIKLRGFRDTGSQLENSFVLHA